MMKTTLRDLGCFRSFIEVIEHFHDEKRTARLGLLQKLSSVFMMKTTPRGLGCFRTFIEVIEHFHDENHTARLGLFQNFHRGDSCTSSYRTTSKIEESLLSISLDFPGFP